MPEKRSALDLVEGYHLAHALGALREIGVLDAMREPVAASDLAAQFKLEPRLLQPVLEYLAGATDLIASADGKFRTTDRYDIHAGFLVDQYLGAYGQNAAHLAEVLKHPGRATWLVDRQRHAQAFAKLGQPGVALLPALVRQLELKQVLDLGCGPGTLLLELAGADPDFRGWGLDASAQMRALADSEAAGRGFSDRLSFIQGDAARLQECVPDKELEEVETVVAASLLNEFFAKDSSAAIRFLQSLREKLPGRALLVSDYYGCLGQQGGRWFPQTALHDFVQVISGQGVPPPDLKSWEAIYAAAGCTLIHALEDDNAAGFVHIVRL